MDSRLKDVADSRKKTAKHPYKVPVWPRLAPSLAWAPCVPEDDAMKWIRKTSNGKTSIGLCSWSTSP